MDEKRKIKSSAWNLSSFVFELGVIAIVIINYLVNRVIMFDLVAIIIFSLAVDELYCYWKLKEKSRLVLGIMFLLLSVIAVSEIIV